MPEDSNHNLGEISFIRLSSPPKPQRGTKTLKSYRAKTRVLRYTCSENEVSVWTTPPAYASGGSMSSSLFLIFIPNHSTELRRSKEG